MQFVFHASDDAALAANADNPAIQRLAWFNGGFMRARVEQDRLVLSDLRMGMDPDYTFNFAVAHRVDDAWQAIAPEQIRPDYAAAGRRGEAGARLAAMWRRIWQPAAVAQ
jgi:inner membrane protein